MLSDIPEISLGQCECCGPAWGSWRDFLEDFDREQPPAFERAANPLTFRWNFRADLSTPKRRAIDVIVNRAVALAAANGFISEYDEAERDVVLVGVVRSFANH